MTRAANAQARRRHRASAARQAIALCETDLSSRPRTSAATARAALRAAGLPPHLAASLRRRLRLTAEQEQYR